MTMYAVLREDIARMNDRIHFPVTFGEAWDRYEELSKEYKNETFVIVKGKKVETYCGNYYYIDEFIN